MKTPLDDIVLSSRARSAAAALLAVLLIGCAASESTPIASREPEAVPRWAQEAVWYQIFVERFRNGDPSNDPTPGDMDDSLNARVPPGWRTTPWGHDWYRLDPWAENNEQTFYESVFARRYGGDLAGQLATELKSQNEGIPEASRRALMNLAASHDTERLLSSLANTGKYKESARLRNPDNRDYSVSKPGLEVRQALQQVLTLQFTYVGAPQIYYGDEVGMWGANDPDCRKPMVWDDVRYEDEEASPFGAERAVDPVAPDGEILDLYKKLIDVRKAHAELFVDGDLRFIEASDEDVLAYERSRRDERALVAFNRSTTALDVTLRALEGAYRNMLSEGRSLVSKDGALELTLEPRSALLLIRQSPGAEE